jgi:hypothetical protein
MDRKEDTLAAGESKTRTIRIKTDADEKNRKLHIIYLTAAVKGNRELAAEGRSITEILPRNRKIPETMIRIPSIVATRYLSGTSSFSTPKNFSAIQLEAKGSGRLDEGGKQLFEYLVRTCPDARKYSLYGYPDEYFVHYKTSLVDAAAGDQIFTMTQLTDNYRYGRGIQARVDVGGPYVGAAHLRSRWIEPELREQMAYVGYSFDKDNDVSCGIMKKRYMNSNLDADMTRDTISTISGKMKPLKTSLSLEGEYALGLHDKAYTANLTGGDDRLNYGLKLIHAGPRFFGYFNNMNFTSLRLSAPVTDKTRINIDYRDERDNLDLNPLYFTAPREKFLTADVEYKLKNNSILSLEYRSRTYRDYFPQSQFNYNSTTWGIRASHKIGKLSLSPYVRFGQTVDYQTGLKYPYFSGRISANYTLNKWQSFGGYAEYDKERKFQGFPSRRFNYALKLNTRLGKNTLLSIDCRRDLDNRYVPGTPFSWNTGDSWLYPDRWIKYKRDLIDVSLKRTLRNGNFITLRGRSSSLSGSSDYPLNENEKDFLAEYSVPIGVPIGKKMSVGTLRGRIIDNTDGKAIPDVIARIGKLTSLTDKNGNFTFVIEPGTYFLTIDRGRIGVNRTTVQEMPLKVEILGGKVTNVEIQIIPNSEIAGQVAVFSYKDAGLLTKTAEADLVKAYGLRNCYVELTNGKETRRTNTDEDGKFRFMDLVPGRWTLMLFNENLPDNHFYETEKIEIEVHNGESKNIDVRVLPRIRKIQFIDHSPGNVLEEKKIRK